MDVPYEVIDLKQWSRAPYFQLYTKMIPTGYSISVELDVTKLYEYCNEYKIKFAIAYRYLTMKLVNEREEFRIAYKNGKLVRYKYLIPSFANFHEDDKTTSIMWVEYKETFQEFEQLYVKEEALYSHVHGIVAKPMAPPENCCMVGVIPWISFQSYAPTPYAAPTQFFPVLQAGKFKKMEGKVLMPFSVTISHAVADGYQVSEYIEALQLAMNQPENSLYRKK